MLPSLAAVASDEEVSVRGSTIWRENGRTQHWVEPFLICVEEKDDHIALLDTSGQA